MHPIKLGSGSAPIVTEKSRRKPQLAKPVSGKPMMRYSQPPQPAHVHSKRKRKQPKTGIESYLDGVEAQMQRSVQHIPDAIRPHRPRVAVPARPPPMQPQFAPPFPVAGGYPFVNIPPGMPIPPPHPHFFHPMQPPPRKKRKLNDTYRYSLASLGIPEDDIPQKLYALNNLPKIRHGDDQRRELKREIKRELEALDKAGEKGNKKVDMFPVTTKQGSITMKVEKLNPARIKAIKLSAELASQPVNPFLRTDHDYRVIEKYPRVLPLHQKARALATIAHVNEKLGFTPTSFIQGAALKSVDDSTTKVGNFVKKETIIPGEESQIEDNSGAKYDGSWNLVGVTNKKFSYAPVSSYGLRMMKSMGFKEGKGLGKSEAGMTTFIRHLGQHHSKGIRALGETTTNKSNGFASCILCDKVFNSMHSIFQHATSKKHVQNLSRHPNNRVLRCNPCMIEFSNQTLLRQHYVLVAHDHPGVSGLASVQKKVGQKKPTVQSKGNGSFQVVNSNDKTCFKCSVCGCTSIIGISQFTAHLNGKRHSRELKKMSKKDRAAAESKIAADMKFFSPCPPVPPKNTPKGTARNEQERFSCEICGVLNVVKTQYDAHVAGKKHQKALKREKQLKSLNRFGHDPRMSQNPTRAGEEELYFAQKAYQNDQRNNGRMP